MEDEEIDLTPTTKATTSHSLPECMAPDGAEPCGAFSWHYDRVLALEAEVGRLRGALQEIYDCMGGDGMNGWDAPEDVWGIAAEALRADDETNN